RCPGWRGSPTLTQTPPSNRAKVPLRNEAIGRRRATGGPLARRMPRSDSSFSNSKIVSSRLNSRVRTGLPGATPNDSSGPGSRWFKSANGRTWTPPVRVNNDATAFAQTNPSLALDSGNNISIAWVDGRSGNQDIWFSRSTNGGQSFSPNVLVNLVTTNAQTEVRIAV